MSKGYGKCQRMILGKLDDSECFYLVDLLPPGYRLKDYQAFHRAAWSLYKAGKLDVRAYLLGAKKILIMRPGYEITKRLPVKVYQVT